MREKIEILLDVYEPDELLDTISQKPDSHLLIPRLLGVVDDFRTFDWYQSIKYPELVYQKTQILLNS